MYISKLGEFLQRVCSAIFLAGKLVLVFINIGLQTPLSIFGIAFLIVSSLAIHGLENSPYIYAFLSVLRDPFEYLAFVPVIPPS